MNLAHDIQLLIIDTQRRERDAVFSGEPARPLSHSALDRLPPRERAWFRALLEDAALTAFEANQETLWVRVHPLCRRARRRLLLIQLKGLFRGKTAL
ncbi:hypothetical protein KPL74_01925 [Bacillus sp. NP157]|nr:hypothetical protein KPL74_01925 [Bacillus sp. NP157]